MSDQVAEPGPESDERQRRRDTHVAEGGEAHGEFNFVLIVLASMGLRKLPRRDELGIIDFCDNIFCGRIFFSIL